MSCVQVSGLENVRKCLQSSCASTILRLYLLEGVLEKEGGVRAFSWASLTAWFSVRPLEFQILIFLACACETRNCLRNSSSLRRNSRQFQADYRRRLITKVHVQLRSRTCTWSGIPRRICPAWSGRPAPVWRTRGAPRSISTNACTRLWKASRIHKCFRRSAIISIQVHPGTAGRYLRFCPSLWAWSSGLWSIS